MKGIGKIQFVGDFLDQGVGVQQERCGVAHFESHQKSIGSHSVKSPKYSGEIGGGDAGFAGDFGHRFEPDEMLFHMSANALAGRPRSCVCGRFSDRVLGNLQQQRFDQRGADALAELRFGSGVADQQLEDLGYFSDIADVSVLASADAAFEKARAGCLAAAIQKIFKHGAGARVLDPMRNSGVVGEDGAGM